MQRFDFKEKGLKLDIAGHVFKVDLEDPEFIESLTNFQKEAAEKAAELKSYEGGSYAEGLKKAIEFTTSAIDKILGPGASEKIFEGRKVNFSDTLDVIAYIQGQVSENSDTVAENYVSYANRAQRRAAGRK